ELREEALLVLGEARLGSLRAPCQFLHELAGLAVDLRRRHHLHGHPQVATLLGAQARDAAAIDLEHIARLHARAHLEVDGAIEAVDRRRRAENRVGHRHLERREQVVAVAAEHGVHVDVNLDVQVAVRAAGGADLAGSGELQTQARLDTGRDVEANGAARAHATLAATRGAGVLDAGAVALAGSTRGLRDDVTQQAAHLALHVTGSATDITARGLGTGLAARAVAGLAENRGVDVDIAVGAEDDVAEAERQTHERVFAALTTRTRATAARSATATEEGLENVAEATESATSEAAHRVVATHVVTTALLRVAQHFIGVRDVLELFRSFGRRVHVGVQLARKLAVSLLDLVSRGLTRDSEYVVVVCHFSPFRGDRPR